MAEDEPLRLLVLCAGDPESQRTFSGSARSLIAALEGLGCVHHTDNVLGPVAPFAQGPAAVRFLRKIDRFGFEERYYWSRAYFARNSRRAQAIAQAHPGFNACLMYGTTFRPQLDVPTYCYFDATAAQVYRAKAWEFGRMPPAQAQRVIAYQREVFADCAAVLPRTQWAARSVIEDYGLPERCVLAVGAGTNYAAQPLPHAPYDRQTILFVGTEFERKGGPLLLDAFARVRRTLPEARLVIIGCSPEVDAPGVEVVGRVDKAASGGLERLLGYYAEASLFCIMSAFEPFGIVVIEAQDSYVPCVVPARFAFSETVVDGVTGRHVPEYDAPTLAEVLAGLLADPSRLEAMGRAAHAHVRAHWTWEDAARRIRGRIVQDLRA